jgi:hypothetical protein
MRYDIMATRPAPRHHRSLLLVCRQALAAWVWPGCGPVVVRDMPGSPGLRNRRGLQAPPAGRRSRARHRGDRPRSCDVRAHNRHSGPQGASPDRDQGPSPRLESMALRLTHNGGRDVPAPRDRHRRGRAGSQGESVDIPPPSAPSQRQDDRASMWSCTRPGDPRRTSRDAGGNGERASSGGCQADDSRP